jgi:hypothetical protein
MDNSDDWKKKITVEEIDIVRNFFEHLYAQPTIVRELVNEVEHTVSLKRLLKNLDIM